MFMQESEISFFKPLIFLFSHHIAALLCFVIIAEQMQHPVNHYPV